MDIFNRVRIIIFLLSFMLLKSQKPIPEFDSLLINKPESMFTENIPRKDIITWNMKMLEKAKKENYDRGMVLIYINLGIQYYNLGKPDIGLEYLDKSKKLSETANVDDKILSRLYQEFSQIYFTMGLFDLCLKYNSKAKYYAEKLSASQYKRRFLNFVYRSRSNALSQAKRDSSLFYIQKSIRTYEAPENYCMLASYYIERNEHLDSAKIYLTKAETMYRKIKNVNRYSISVLYYYFAKMEIKQGNYEVAIGHLERSLSFSSNGKNRQHLLNVYSALAESYHEVGNLEKEKETLTNYKKFVDSYNNSFTKSVEFTVNNAAEEKERDKLSWENRYIIIIVGIVISFFILFLIYFLRNQKINRNKIDGKNQITSDNLSTSIKAAKNTATDIDELYKIAKARDPNFPNKFQLVYPEFIKSILAVNPNMQRSELQLLAYIYLNFDTKEIAELLFLSPKTIQNRKHSIRKKLSIASSENMYIWLKSLES